MKTKQVWIVGVLAALLLVPMAFAADGQPGPRGPEGFGGPGYGQMQRPGMMGRGPQGDAMGGIDIGQHIRMLMQSLELTPEQQEAIKGIMEENRPAAQENRKALQEATKALREAVMEGDVEAVKTCAETFSKAMTQQSLAGAKVIKEVKAQLTPEQLEKLKATRTQMQERAQQGRPQRDEQMNNDERPAPEDEPADAPQPPRQRQDRPRARRNAQ